MNVHAEQLPVESLEVLRVTHFVDRDQNQTENEASVENSERNDIQDEESVDALKLSSQRGRQSLKSALALPYSLSVSSLQSSLHSILCHPKLPKIALSSLQVGLALYLLNGIWKAAIEVMDELDIGRDTSPHLLKVEQVRQIVKELDENNQDGSRLLQQQPTLQHLTQTLLASGMPLRSFEEENSVERVLLSLTRAEANILQQCLWVPSSGSSPTSFSEISGLHTIKQSLLDLVWTLKSGSCSNSAAHNQNPYSHLVEHPPGVLLYGPPGCGKTMLVKALAAATKLPCLVVTQSVLFRKYVGETQLQVRALFSLAKKLSPCILCIDELDGLFRERSATEHDVSRDLKTEFLQWYVFLSCVRFSVLYLC